MRFFKVKFDVNDTLYSQIIRHNKVRCDKCHQVRELQCAHIMSRRHYPTRFMLEPICNAVALCAYCHDWFDTHKMRELLLDPKKRVLDEESYTWLVRDMRYTWDQLLTLLVKAHSEYSGYSLKKKLITTELRQHLKSLQHQELPKFKETLF